MSRTREPGNSRASPWDNFGLISRSKIFKIHPITAVREFFNIHKKELQFTRGTQGARGIPGYSYIATPENLRNPLLTYQVPIF